MVLVLLYGHQQILLVLAYVICILVCIWKHGSYIIGVSFEDDIIDGLYICIDLYTECKDVYDVYGLFDCVIRKKQKQSMWLMLSLCFYYYYAYSCV